MLNFNQLKLIQFHEILDLYQIEILKFGRDDWISQEFDEIS
jgi:hypothetical protein